MKFTESEMRFKMLDFLKNWKGSIEINGAKYDDISTVDLTKNSGPISIKLYPSVPENPIVENTENVTKNTEKQYLITVKQYMTQPATPSFDFMAKWNNNNPMPLRTMVGTVEKETRGMVYMKLHGQAEPVIKCMRCGKQLTNPISKHYGIGPECMAKLGIIADIEDVELIKKKLVDVTWEGWVVRSSILEKEEVN